MNPNDTPTNEKCPHCGAEPIESFTGYPNVTGVAILKQRSCGSVIDPLYPERETRSELCRERGARQKLEAEVERLKAELSDFSLEKSHAVDMEAAAWANRDIERHKLEKAEAEVARLREILIFAKDRMSCDLKKDIIELFPK